MRRGARASERPAQSVRKEPGATAVTWMPNAATSLPSASLMPSSANLLPQYQAMPGMVMKPPMEVMLRMWPRRRARMCGSTALISAAGPNTFTSN
ncbi:hypothetical protein G6F59_018169 [Rhizopus arrhizus]|nr:hypothetical protein G6F59_018169 [Rhizopus arrhizus]